MRSRMNVHIAGWASSLTTGGIGNPEGRTCIVMLFALKGEFNALGLSDLKRTQMPHCP
jgi:hypothetical protein